MIEFMFISIIKEKNNTVSPPATATIEPGRLVQIRLLGNRVQSVE